MAWTFNPFSGTFDQKGSGGGGGSSYLEGEVQNFSALPTSTPPAVDAAYLVREAEGTWLLNRKPAGIYIRVATTGTRATDWTYAGEFPDVFSDANFLLYDESDSTKNLKFQLSGITTGTTRTLTAPDASGTIALTTDVPSALNDLSNVSAAAPSDNDVLVYDNATSTWVAEAPAAGGVSAIGTSAADVLSVSGSDLVADDGGTIDSADPFIKWDDTAGKLVYANPLSRPSGAFYVGLAPTTTALGTGAINLQTSRSLGATRIASGSNSIVVGNNSLASGSYSIAIGDGSLTIAENAITIGRQGWAQANDSIGIGYGTSMTGVRSVGIGRQAVGSLRALFLTLPFSSIYWGGETTNATATVLNLDRTATNRFTIAANTALAVDILLVARRSDVADKWLVARRFLGIRRDGSNNTSLIGSVQTLGTDQSDGSPSWTFALTADDTNEALQLEVTGAASETVQWRATAFYRVV